MPCAVAPCVCPLDDHRVDDRAAVLDDRITHEADTPRLRVDLDHAGVGGVRVADLRRVEALASLVAALTPPRPARRPRRRAPGRRPRGRRRRLSRGPAPRPRGARPRRRPGARARRYRPPGSRRRRRWRAAGERPGVPSRPPTDVSGRATVTSTPGARAPARRAARRWSTGPGPWRATSSRASPSRRRRASGKRRRSRGSRGCRVARTPSS